VSALAATGLIELLMMLLSYGIVRLWDSVRRRQAPDPHRPAPFRHR